MSKTVMEQARDIRQHYRETAESITYTTGEHGRRRRNSSREEHQS